MGTPIESEGTPQESTDDVQVETPDQSSSPGHNPAWDEVLSLIPEQLHGSITPHFQKWDQAAQSRIESINKQYEPYKPLIDHGIDIGQVTEGLQFMHMANNNPKELYEQLGSALGITAKQAEEVVQEELNNSDDNEEVNPELDRLKQGFELLAQRVLDEDRAKEAAKFDDAVTQELEEVKKAIPGIDEQAERWILANVHQNLLNENFDYTIADSAQEFAALRDSILQSNPRPFAPAVIGSNSGSGVGLPSQQVDVTKLSNNDTRSLVAEYARKMAQQQK